MNAFVIFFSRSCVFCGRMADLLVSVAAILIVNVRCLGAGVVDKMIRIRSPTVG